MLLDLQAHQLFIGERLSEDLLEPNGVHPLFHSFENYHLSFILQSSAWLS